MTPEEQAQQEQAQNAEREAREKSKQLRLSALMIADDQHGNDEDIVQLKKNIAIADAQFSAHQQEALGLQMDTQYARILLDKALESFIDRKYQLSEEEWEQVEAQFKRG